LPLAKRIIPCLDVDKGRVVKGVNFVDIRDADDPVEIAKRYNDQGADEITFLDITVSHEGRETTIHTVEEIAGEVFIPLTVGGGIRELSDIRNMLNAGADKVGINSAAVKNPEFVKAASDKFGAQCIVVAIDAKQVDNQWKVHLVGGKVPTELNLFDWAKEVEERGAGEILFTSMDHDGTKNGFANEALARLSNELNIPIIASGGAGMVQHFTETFKKGKADAALAASVFHFGEIEIKSLKQELRLQGIPIRL